MKKLMSMILPVALGISHLIVAQQQEDFKVYSKFDFTPGEKVIFYDDFSAEAAGDFPSRWNTNGTGEIVTTSTFPGRWFQMKGEGYYIPDTEGLFPDNFTVEFDFLPSNDLEDDDQTIGVSFSVISGDINDPDEGGAIPGKAGNRLAFEQTQVDFASYGDGEYKVSGSTEIELKKNNKYRLSVWVQKQRLRVYVDERKVFDAPRAMPAGFTYNVLRFDVFGESRPMIGNLRVAVGLPDMRNKLLTEGKLVSYGVYFDVNSDKVKPQSYATLKEVAQVLKENESVKINIVGHTDSDGNDGANLDLSKRRAASVKNELVAQFGINGSRIETDGKGEAEPLAPNDNSSNKAKNRRVEFIKR